MAQSIRDKDSEYGFEIRMISIAVEKQQQTCDREFQIIVTDTDTHTKGLNQLTCHGSKQINRCGNCDPVNKGQASNEKEVLNNIKTT